VAGFVGDSAEAQTAAIRLTPTVCSWQACRVLGALLSHRALIPSTPPSGAWRLSTLQPWLVNNNVPSSSSHLRLDGFVP
jgi:hypothetical protein